MTNDLHLWCPSGLSGDMFAALSFGLGLDIDLCRSLIDEMGLSENIEILLEDGVNGAFHGPKFSVVPHGEMTTRRFADILSLFDAINRVDIAETAKRILSELAVIEAKLHGSAVEEVTFHEVGAWDTIADVVVAATAICELSIEKVYLHYLEVGKGLRITSHGAVTIPAPATIEGLVGIEFHSSVEGKELLTPTAMAILKASGAVNFGDGAILLDKVAIGIGEMVLDDRSNHVRGGLSKMEEKTADERVVLIQTNLDDRSPEFVASMLNEALEAGALDVWQVAMTGKKSRAGVVINVLARSEDQQMIEDLILSGSGSLGVRSSFVDRRILPREMVVVDLSGDQVRVKVGPHNSKIESDDLIALAKGRSISLLEAQRMVIKEFIRQFPDKNLPL
ncbi:MAG: LarC family nickel insertion protein [Actinomycetota bacterium]|nr:LarC family nickel insertion protein [Actinomycetota bacterium]